MARVKGNDSIQTGSLLCFGRATRSTRWHANGLRVGGRKDGRRVPLPRRGFVRITSNPAFSRDAVQPRAAMDVLSANTACKDHVFWSDEIPFREAVAFLGFRLLIR